MSATRFYPRAHLASWPFFIVVLSSLLLGWASLIIGDLNLLWMLKLNQFLAQPPYLSADLDVFWSCITVLGLGLSLFILLAGFTVQRPAWMAAFLICLLFGGGLIQLLKHMLHSPRPAAVLLPSELHIIGAALFKNSMPSGHAASVFACAAILILTPSLRTATPSPYNLLWRLAVLVLAVLIACSRIAVGAHWPQDVLVGSLLGWLFGAFSVLLVQNSAWLIWCQSKTSQWILALSGLVGSGVLIMQSTGYPLAQSFQWLLGGIGASLATSRLYALGRQRQRSVVVL